MTICLMSYFILLPSVVKFVQRSESEPVRSSVEEELGMIGRLRLVKEVGEDARESLQDGQDDE